MLFLPMRIGATRVRMVGGHSVMLGQEISAPVPLELSPHAVDMVRVVLGVVVLDQERGTLDAVVVALTFPEPAHPRDLDGRRFGLDPSQPPLLLAPGLGGPAV